MKIELENAVVYQGSNLDVLPTLPDNSVDSIVTDPPYELGFMGKSWDNSGIAYSVELWTECMRVLKPGGHLLAFGGSRTWHRLAVAIEDAGFEMRDSIAWLYGSGFPKSMDISKQIDKQAGAEREVIGSKIASPKGISGAENRSDTAAGAYGGEAKEIDITAPATPEAKQWQGWGTALKPAFEPVVVARKPLEEKTVAANVLKFGTGGLNIDDSRIVAQDQKELAKNWDRTQSVAALEGRNSMSGGLNTIDLSGYKAEGRWPANIILDPYTAELLDEQSGISKSQGGQKSLGAFRNGDVYGSGKDERSKGDPGFGDTGGASRFFYVAKASKKDRNEGLDDLEAKLTAAANFRPNHLEKAVDGDDGLPYGRWQPTKNFHPTVKPTALMEYLIKLVTPPNGTVLDPFTGSGSTGKAALLSGFKFIGIELTEEYLPIIEGRLKWASQQASKETNEVLF